MKINFDEICDRIYAATALAVITEQNDAFLLHSDHSEALKNLIHDEVASIVIEIGQAAIKSTTLTDESVEIEFTDPAVDISLVKAMFISTATRQTLGQIKLAASSRPEEVIKLASSLQAAARSLVDYVSTRTSPARIVPSF